MKINRITIRNFGKIHNMTLALGGGINVLFGENESGKTTIHVFLKSMFYGLGRQRGRAAKNDTYSTYEPWENPADYGGTVWFEQDGMEYRLTRNFDRSHPGFELFCETDGSVWEDEEKLSELLGEVSEAVFDNTVSVGQLKSVTGKDLVRELQNYMASYQGTGDTSLDLGRASQMLKMSRKGFQVQADRRRKELQKEQEKLDAGIAYLEREIGTLQDQKEKIDEKRKSLRLGENGGEVLRKHIRDAERSRIITMLAVAAVCVLGLAAGVAFSSLPVRVVCGVVCLAALGIGLARKSKLDKEIRKRKKLREKWMAKNKKIHYDKDHNDGAIDEKKRARSSLRSARAELEEEMALPREEDEEIEALTLALETIEVLSGNMNRQVGRRLKTRTSEILSEITGGKYRDVLMDEELHMSVNTGDRVVPLEGLSRGTLEQIYLSLRIAAGELFCGEEPFPIILDDIFGMYDADRLASALRWLYQEGRQILILTCSRREMEILDQENITYRGHLL